MTRVSITFAGRRSIDPESCSRYCKHGLVHIIPVAPVLLPGMGGTQWMTVIAIK